MKRRRIAPDPVIRDLTAADRSKWFVLGRIHMEDWTFNDASLGQKKIESLTPVRAVGMPTISLDSTSLSPSSKDKFEHWELLPPELKMNVLSKVYSESERIWYTHSELQFRRSNTNFPLQLSVSTSKHFIQLFTSKSFFETALPLLASSTVVNIQRYRIDNARLVLKDLPQWARIFDALLRYSRTVEIGTPSLYRHYDKPYYMHHLKYFHNLKKVEIETNRVYVWFSDKCRIRMLSRRSRIPQQRSNRCDVKDLKEIDLKESWKTYAGYAGQHEFNSLQCPHKLRDLQRLIPKGCEAYLLVNIEISMRYSSGTSGLVRDPLVCRINLHDLENCEVKTGKDLFK